MFASLGKNSTPSKHKDAGHSWASLPMHYNKSTTQYNSLGNDSSRMMGASRTLWHRNMGFLQNKKSPSVARSTPISEDLGFLSIYQAISCSNAAMYMRQFVCFVTGCQASLWNIYRIRQHELIWTSHPWKSICSAPTDLSLLNGKKIKEVRHFLEHAEKPCGNGASLVLSYREAAEGTMTLATDYIISLA